MRRRGNRTLWPWLLVAVVGTGLAQALFAAPSRAALDATQAQVLQGRQLFEESCATCHGPMGEGTSNGPSLLHAGPAALDFMLSTGRMPLAEPGVQPQRQTPAFTPEQIRAIIAFVATFSTGGTPIPFVDVAAGNVQAGQQAYEANCGACHASAGSGDSIGGNQIAPALDQATPIQIAEAIRFGPGPMPRFGETAVSQDQLNSIVRYLLYLRQVPNHGGLGLSRVGPVAEGFVGVVIGLGLILLVVKYTGTNE